MNKRLITIFVGLALVAVMLIVNFTVFVVKTVEVELTTSAVMTDDEILAAKQQIVEAADVKIGKSIFALSESRISADIENANSEFQVKRIERFPSKVVLHVVKRAPIMALPFYDGEVLKYAVVDSMMVVTDIVLKSELKSDKLAVVENFLSSKGTIEKGKQLSGFGDMVIQLQNVAVAFQYAGLNAEGFSLFIRNVSISANNSKMNLLTNENVYLVIDLKEDTVALTTEQLKSRVDLAYGWYLENRDNPAFSGGQAIYDRVSGSYTWYSI